MTDQRPAPVGAGVYNVYTGEPDGGPEPTKPDGGPEPTKPDGGPEPTTARLGLEPPRFCAACGRRMVVQVRPDGWWAQCSRHGRVDSADLESQR